MSLHERARALLALREQATPGPWVAEDASYGQIICMDRGARYPQDIAVVRNDSGKPHHENTIFIRAAHDMADLIRDQDAKIAELLAENERLNGVVQAQHETMMEAIARTNAAESQLRELASAEPVKYEYEWFDPGLGRYDENWGELRPRHGQTMEQKVAEIESYQRKDGNGPMYRVRALIRRPEMP